MNGSLRVSRVTPMKLAASLVVPGGLIVAVAACGGSGSNTSASSAQTKSAPPARGFSVTKGVSLTVVNKDPAGIKARMCAPNQGCNPDTPLGLDQSVNREAAEGKVDGAIIGAGYTFDFDAVNPTIGEPYIQLRNGPLFWIHINGHVAYDSRVSFTEGQCVDAYLTNPPSPIVFSFTGQRATDNGDDKIMTLTTYPRAEGNVEHCRTSSSSPAASSGQPESTSPLSTSPSGAGEVIRGCTIVSNPTPENHTVCPLANLSGEFLVSHDLSHADLSEAILIETRLNAADLKDANLSDARLSGASFGSLLEDGRRLRTNLTGANLRGATGADLRDAVRYVVRRCPTERPTIRAALPAPRATTPRTRPLLTSAGRV